MKTAVLFCILVLRTSCIKNETVVIQPKTLLVYASSDDIKSAYEYLNTVRANPKAYSTEIGVDLSEVDARSALVWNDALTKAAQAKSADMAARNYFDHVDPDGNGMNIKIDQAGYQLKSMFLTEKNQNNFESIAAGDTSPVEAIRQLIADDGIDPPGHRQHLLGMIPFWANCYDIGIGFAKGTASNSYISYCSIIIAKHGY